MNRIWKDDLDQKFLISSGGWGGPRGGVQSRQSRGQYSKGMVSFKSGVDLGNKVAPEEELKTKGVAEVEVDGDSEQGDERRVKREEIQGQIWKHLQRGRW
jgi:hypothetical protein